MIKKILAILAATLIVVGCDKEIDLGYNDVDPFYVVNSYTDQNESYVSITRSSGMYSPMDQTQYEANVTLTKSDGNSYTLSRAEDGSYYSTAATVSSVGESFTLDIAIDGEHYVSTSTVMAQPENVNIEFVTDVVMGLTGISCKITGDRGEAVDRYFKYMLYHEDKILESGSYKKSADDLSQLSTSIFFAMKEDGKITAFDTEETEIEIGDDITVYFYAIDEMNYDYFYTLSLATQTNSNPTYCFTGDCLGYYTAYISSSFTKPFSID